jgi:hypothetical protein
MTYPVGRVRVASARSETDKPVSFLRPAPFRDLCLIHVTDAEVQRFATLDDGRDQLAQIVAWHESSRLEQQELQGLLRTTWPCTRALWDVNGVPVRAVVRTFRDAGFVTNMPGQALPQEPVTLYRGAHARDGVRGFSWTTDRPVAALFAKKALDDTGTGVLAKTVIAPRHILGMFDLSRDVHAIEYVISPFALRWRDITMMSADDPDVLQVARDHRIQLDMAIARSIQSWIGQIRSAIHR